MTAALGVVGVHQLKELQQCLLLSELAGCNTCLFEGLLCFVWECRGPHL